MSVRVGDWMLSWGESVTSTLHDGYLRGGLSRDPGSCSRHNETPAHAPVLSLRRTDSESLMQSPTDVDRGDSGERAFPSGL